MKYNVPSIQLLHSAERLIHFVDQGSKTAATCHDGGPASNQTSAGAYEMDE